MKIRVRHPGIGEAVFLLGESSAVTIGRSGTTAACEFGWDSKISERHALMWIEAGGVWFEDLGSRQGSYLGDRRIEGRLALARGDAVRIGDTMLLVPDELDEWAADDQRLWTPSDETVEASSEWVEDRPRRHHRYTTRHPVVVRVLPDGEPRKAIVRDVSVGGIFLEAKMPPANGTGLIIAVETDRGTLRLRGEVVHVVDADRSRVYTIPTGVGIRLNGVAGVVEQEWLRFLRSIGVPAKPRRAPPRAVWTGDELDDFDMPEPQPWWRALANVFTPAWERTL